MSSPSTTVHDSRTLMLQELERLFEGSDAGASVANLREAVMEANVLLKSTGRTRQASFKYLRRLYGLDRNDPIYRSFRRLWDADPLSRPQLALLMALRHDRLMRLSSAPILKLNVGEAIVWPDLEGWLRPHLRSTASPKTVRSASQNLLSSWRQVGLLQGVTRKQRVHLQPRPAAVALALRLGYDEGARGLRLFETVYAQALDSTPSQLDDLAHQAAVAGWLHYRRIADVLDVFFDVDGAA